MFQRSYFVLPKGPSTQYSRTLVPKAMPFMVFGTRVLKYWVLGPSGTCYFRSKGPKYPKIKYQEAQNHNVGSLCFLVFGAPRWG